jgi:hypothetical protein
MHAMSVVSLAIYEVVWYIMSLEIRNVAENVYLIRLSPPRRQSS